MSDWNTPKVFDVTEQHMALLSRIWFGYNDWEEFGAPQVDPKRPYGNSDVYEDIAEILDIAPEVDEWGDKTFNEDQQEYMHRLHREMETVLQILVANAAEGIRPGLYIASRYGTNWKSLG